MQTQTDLAVKMIIDSWNVQNKRVDKLINTLTEDQLRAQTSPGRNSGIYLIGHLIGVSDNILELLGWGEKMYPQLVNVFLKNPDNAGLEKPSLDELKKYWNEINAKIAEHIHAMKTEDWFEKHTAVSAEDFAKEPHRNKLNIIISRTNHTSYHLGQLIYLEKK
jgi:DinB family protein